ncbi:helix-turn-helix domain-containing protein [Lactobacillus gasseri]|uniref:helix-turn-helix domain-containing protein n=1 Tax=Lactobacillus gasseri TaxID=1596 RepID=UPI000E43D676|nr:helix-turn-helix transcriptional regulator [Lactobacillus gasseri]MBW0440921.1 helix-turn-helix transcriptional regulator [Lactobacillus gasseri]MBW0452672.1 helix-turn-helix transcriptional regulator [Lactobacillus gasseri]MBW0460226.1 helix-turn-helix transcriptional regulator [Lactobacillus gasseri]MCT7749987.1 helix-turn-helix domain-containing protein [Lactobacillus gasseri]MCZ3527426.1 helix-turn-helix domain-containing protein [Lactobacillus gasseri]
MTNQNRTYNQLFAERIKKLRLTMGFTQDQFVDYLNSKGLKISRTSLARYEAQLSTPTSPTLQKLSHIFGISTDYFLEDTDLSQTYKKITSTLHSHYFSKIYADDELHKEIKSWIDDPFSESTLTDPFLNIKLKNPYRLYIDEEGDIKEKYKTYPITSKIAKFWQSMFDFLYKDIQVTYFLNSKESPSFEDLLAQKIKTHKYLIDNENLVQELIDSTANIAKSTKLIVSDYKNGLQPYTAIVDNTQKAILKLNSLYESLKNGLEQSKEFIDNK